MKRLIPFVLFAALLLSSCNASANAHNANSCAKLLISGEELFLACVEEMEKLGEERIYVAMEA